MRKDRGYRFRAPAQAPRARARGDPALAGPGTTKQVPSWPSTNSIVSRNRAIPIAPPLCSISLARAGNRSSFERIQERRADTRRLVFPVWSAVDLVAATAALSAHHARAEPRHLGFSRIARHVDQRRVTASVVQAGRKQPLHAQRAHVGERHRRAVGLLGLHSITSSARSKNASETVSPNAFADLRLITNSNLSGCSIGRSSGLSPRKILVTNGAIWRNAPGPNAPSDKRPPTSVNDRGTDAAIDARTPAPQPSLVQYAQLPPQQ
jgi:hypothetical protein